MFDIQLVLVETSYLMDLKDCRIKEHKFTDLHLFAITDRRHKGKRNIESKVTLVAVLST